MDLADFIDCVTLALCAASVSGSILLAAHEHIRRAVVSDPEWDSCAKDDA